MVFRRYYYSSLFFFDTLSLGVYFVESVEKTVSGKGRDLIVVEIGVKFSSSRPADDACSRLLRRRV